MVLDYGTPEATAYRPVANNPLVGADCVDEGMEGEVFIDVVD